MSKNKEVLKNIGLSIIYKPIGILISLALVPLTIKYLGNTSYGLWATILSIISWINYFDIGIGNGLRNHLAREITVRNYKESREYIMTAYGSVTFISIIILLTLMILFRIFNWNSIFNIESYTNQELFFIMLVNLFFIVLNFVLKIVATIYYSLQKSSTVGLIQILNQLFNLIGIYNGKALGFIQQESVFWSKKLWEKVPNGLIVNYKLSGDYFLWKNFAKYENLYTINAVLSGFRIHKNQQTNNMHKYYDEIKSELKFFNFLVSKIRHLVLFKLYFFNKNELLIKSKELFED